MGKIEKIGKLAEKGKAEKIVAFVRDKDKQVSLAAITALGKMADNEDAKNTLVSMVENEDADIRRAAVTSLGGGVGKLCGDKAAVLSGQREGSAGSGGAQEGAGGDEEVGRREDLKE